MSEPQHGQESVIRNWRVRVEFKREDCWVGVFWRTERTTRGLLTTWWVCLLPMLPIVIQWGRPDSRYRGGEASDV